MHQHPRPPPRGATPAKNLTTNPERTNNPREQPPTRTRSSVDLTSYTERASNEATATAARSGEGSSSASQDRETTKLNQIVQHFHTKAALMICSSRANLPQQYAKNGDIRQDRWFNIVLDETDVLAEDLYEWRRLDLVKDRPPALVIDIYLDTANLSNNQALVLTDGAGKRWDVADALASSAESSPRSTKNGGRFCEVVVERWKIELSYVEGDAPGAPNEGLPNVYKKGVVLFRSLYTFLRFLPAWKLFRKSKQAGNHHGLRLRFRIRQGQEPVHAQRDSLPIPLTQSEQGTGDVTQSHVFDDLATPAGRLRCSVDYRSNTAFSVATHESLLSSRFLGLDEGVPTLAVVGRSLPDSRTEHGRGPYSSTAAPTRTAVNTTHERPRGLLGAYGSLGTFHAPDKRGSPVSELKQRALQTDAEEEDMQRINAIREEEGIAPRRASVNYQYPPFKAGSLASSPRPSPSPGTSYSKPGSLLDKYAGKTPSPSTSAGRPESLLQKYGGGGGGSSSGSGSATAPSSKRASVGGVHHQQLRVAAPIPNETAVASSTSSSPKPAPVRYSSSFANRPRRFTSTSGGRAAESNASSGRGSSSSKEKSGQLNEGTPGSSGSARTDDDDLAAFISDLERAKDLKFLRSPPAPRESTVNLAKYSSRREPQTQLAEEMSSSSLIQTSVTPPSRRLSNVPGLSLSSSPSRVQPHAPHVRSRLSTHSIVEEAAGASGASGDGSESSPKIQEEEEDYPFIFQQDGL